MNDTEKAIYCIRGLVVHGFPFQFIKDTKTIMVSEVSYLHPDIDIGRSFNFIPNDVKYTSQRLVVDGVARVGVGYTQRKFMFGNKKQVEKELIDTHNKLANFIKDYNLTKR